MFVYLSTYAFCSPATYRAETWHEGRGKSLRGMSDFQNDPWVQGHQRSMCQNCPMATKSGQKNPWPEGNTPLGQRLCRCQLRSTRGQILVKWPHPRHQHNFACWIEAMHARAEYTGVHINNSCITPALSALLQDCTNTHLTDAISAS